MLLATGDFGMNEEMVRAYNPTLLKCCDTMCEPNDVGDGHMMGMWVGAGMDDYAGGDLFPMHTATNRIDLRPLPEEDPAYVAVQDITWRPAVANLPGLVVDMSGRRVDTEGVPIPGLYAAGNTAGSFYGHVYPSNMPGSGIGHGQTFGWLAVKDMLGEDYL